MTEEQLQPLVARVLAETLGCGWWELHPEVSTRDGSRLDLLLVRDGLTGFELKVAQPGEVGLGLDARALRQLRHFAQALDRLYLVTLARPRALELLADGRSRMHEPLEAQLLPERVGWVVVDLLGPTATVLRPAGDLAPALADRLHVLDQLAARVGRVQGAVTRLRAGASCAAVS